MGSADVRAFSRNKRGIAGSLIWSNFDRHALLDLVYKLRGQFVANVDDLRPQFMTDQNAFLSQNAIYQGTLVRENGAPAGTTIDQFSGAPVSSVSGYKDVASPWYSDQVLPFDITLAGTNEQGAATCPLSCHSFLSLSVLTECFAAKRRIFPRAGAARESNRGLAGADR
jgi:hypothetical protein